MVAVYKGQAAFVIKIAEKLVRANVPFDLFSGVTGAIIVTQNQATLDRVVEQLGGPGSELTV